MRRAPVLVLAGLATALSLVLVAASVGDDAAKLPNWQALILGLVQGATELLPISSSGHLILVPWLGDWEYLKTHDEFNQTFDVALHLGTVVAVGLYFAPDIAGLVRALFASLAAMRIASPEQRLAWVVVVATVPAALIGFLGEAVIAENLGEPWQIAIFLAVFALFLAWADRRPVRLELTQVSPQQGLLLGLAQSLSLMPGVSRSGITITTGRLLGLDRDSAARLSFLLLVPITAGAVIFKGLKDVILADLPSGLWGPFAVGVLASFGSGLVAILVLLGIVRRRSYDVFVGYRLVAALVVLLLIASGVRSSGF
ncbi:MAG: undecaprenyl-diphosphate phosphatase [Gaiella sp.]